MFASFDPIALDVACADAVNRQPVLAGSLLDESDHEGHDRFGAVSPTTNWRSCVEHGAKRLVLEPWNMI